MKLLLQRPSQQPNSDSTGGVSNHRCSAPTTRLRPRRQVCPVPCSNARDGAPVPIGKLGWYVSLAGGRSPNHARKNAPDWTLDTKKTTRPCETPTRPGETPTRPGVTPTRPGEKPKAHQTGRKAHQTGRKKPPDRAQSPPGKVKIPPGKVKIPPEKVKIPPGKVEIPPGKVKILLYLRETETFKVETFDWTSVLLRRRRLLFSSFSCFLGGSGRPLYFRDHLRR